MSSADSIFVRWVDSVDDIPADLWAACFAPPLEGRWWYAALQHCGIEDQFTFAYAIIQKSGHPVGIAPTFLMDVPLDIIAPDQLAILVRFVGKFIRFLRYQRTLFVGSPCSDEGTVGLIPGVSLSDIAAPLQAALNDRAKLTRAAMIVWKDFLDEDIAALAPMAAAQNMFRVISYPGTRVPLPAGGFGGYLKSLKSSYRYKVKKKIKDGKAVLPTDASVVQHPNSEVLAEIWPLFWQTYLKGKTKFEKLNRKFFELVAAEPSAYFVLLRDQTTQKLVAFMLCFDCRPRAINKFIGLDYTIENAFLYFQLWEAAVRWASDAGFTELQSGQTGYRAKLDIGNTLVPLTNLCRHRNPVIHRIFAWQAKSIDWKTIDQDLKTHLQSQQAV
jgi:hypothetical protein